ncbi:hypothetical protein F4777DRAFT_483693 [Nemania sp. FL0916]|nr:hypothetical protein F4777DRAFT_483693 [Nemania sp. FL0916]
MATAGIQYSALPSLEAQDNTKHPTPTSIPTPTTTLNSTTPPSPSVSSSSTYSESDLDHLFPLLPPRSPSPISPPTTTTSAFASSLELESLASTQFFPELRGAALQRCRFTADQNRGLGNTLAVLDDVQRRLRGAYATEHDDNHNAGHRFGFGYLRGFQPEAHRQIIREHKVGDWMVVRQGYWEARCAVKAAVGVRVRPRLPVGSIACAGDDGHANCGEDLDINMIEDVDVDVEDAERDKSYDRVVAALKDFLKILTGLKDKALKDKMQVNKQRYTHTSQWLNFLTIGAGVLLYLQNTFFARGPAPFGSGIVGGGGGGGVGFGGNETL